MNRVKIQKYDSRSTLKTRLDPSGVKEIPIRKIGLYRFEIILPKASAEDVEEVKRNITDVGALEFRILANRKHDADVLGGLRQLFEGQTWLPVGT